MVRKSTEGRLVYIAVETEDDAPEYEGGTASVVFAMSDKDNPQVYTASPYVAFKSAEFNYNDLSITGTASVTTTDGSNSGITGIKFKYLKEGGTTNPNLSWFVCPADGFIFTPTRVKGYINRCGTDVEDGIVISVKKTDGETITLGTFTAWRQSKDTNQKPYDSKAVYMYDITLTAEQQVALTGADGFYLMSPVGVGEDKEGLFGQVTIEGEMSSMGDTRKVAPIKWNPESVSITTADEFTSPILVNDENLALTYSSNNPTLATVDNGVISLTEGATGTAVISATYQGDETLYKPTTVDCTIFVDLATETKVGDKTLAVNLSGAVEANTTIFEDELITVVNTEPTKATAVSKVNICGADFTNYVNVRIDGFDNGQFKPQADNSPLMLTPTADMELIVYGRIQNKTENPDLKDIKNCDMYDATMNKVASTGMYFGGWVKNGTNPYAFAYVAQTYDLKADQTYYLVAQGFGFQCYGLGYTPLLSEDAAQLIEELKALIAEAEETDWNSNTETTALALVDAIIEAKKALGFTDAEAIEEVKANLEQAMENLEPQEFEYTTAHTWDFTQWTNETVANLRLDAANSKLSGWSDVEKIDDATADKEPTEASKNNCFWLTADDQTDAEGYLQANGKTITELYGLKVTGDLLTTRNLAIAVNYPKALSDYEGPKYLWIGGKSKTIVITGVKLGSTITMGVESHNTGSKRGVDLYINGTDTKLEGPEEYPTIYEVQTWTVPAEVPAGVADDETAQSVDILVKNNDGCHIYFIDADVEQGPTTAITEVKAEETDAPVVYYNL
ncbi:MAG: hypothetical protein J1E29_08010, partial [Duncaniella sp.]|nr:hypothetical protein [Duncaniella sp.]